MSNTLSRRHFLAGGIGATKMEGADRPPNVVLIYCDDLGFGDIGCYGSPIRTPNLDRMAKEGVRFTQFNSASPLCSPSRAALLTGRYPTRVGVQRVLFPYDRTGLPASETTIAQMLKASGYSTMCVGKWHLGHLPEFLPTSRGFDRYFGIPYSNDMEPPVVMRNMERVEQRANMDSITEQYTNEATRFIDESQAGPFSLYLAHTMPHIPLGAGKRFRGKSPLGIYGDVVEEIDWSVGEVMNALKGLKLDSNTMVFFTSDNGPWFQGSAGRLRGRKGMVWEGGVREPMLARWHGQFPAGATCDGLASTMDLLPTIAKLTRAKLPDPPLDGIDISPMLLGKQPELERDILLYFDAWNIQCARLGAWKLHVARNNSETWSPNPAGGRVSATLPSPELYDLSRDPDESYDVAEDHPEIVTRIRSRIETLVPSFPEPVRSHWAAQRSRVSAEKRKGALSRSPEAAPAK